ncbi:helicase-associated domain-containing protein [Nonomuraea sp. NPDC059194]|uniref:helicase-associated domain-containing protein n=1 Tax=Nonomuraea sp. NPDC059194 TaxID=3346764 RepID=UPI00368577EC
MNADQALLELLSGLDEKALAGLLAVRSDVLRPVPPRRLAELADRLDTPESAYLALSRSSLACLRFAEVVLVAARAGRSLSGLLPDGFDDTGLLDQLERRALVWREGDRLRICSALDEVLPTPLGLGPGLADVLPQITVAELTDMLKRLGGTGTGRKAMLVDSITALLTDDERLAALVARAPEGTRELLDDFAWRGPVQVLDEFPHVGYHHRQRPMTPARWAREHGLVWNVDWEGTAVMPMEVALALRGHGHRVDIPAEPPAITSTPVAAELVAHEASVAALRVLDRAAALLEAVSGEPLQELKGGGVGVKEVRRLARRLGCADDEIRLLLDIAHAAGLLVAQERDGISPTEGYDAWLALEQSERLAALIETWWALPISPTRRYDGKPRTPMTPPSAGTPSSVIREVVFGLLPSDAAVRLPQEVATAASWHLPLIQPASASEVVLSVLEEARLLGLVGADALSPLGLAVRAGSVAEAAGKLLAGARQQALFGADLTAVVTGPPSADLAEVLDRAADRESGGTAGTWRFSPSSVRRALDAGHRADALVAALTEVTSGALPQALTYLINDVARRHGEIGVVAVGCCVVGDDVGLLAELAVHRKLAKLRPRLLAPTVLASALDPARTLALLREAGYAPVAMEADGSLVITAPAARRASQQGLRPRAAVVGAESAAAWLVGTADAPEPEPSFHGLRELFARHATGLAAEGRARTAMELHYYGTTQVTYDGEDLTISSPEVCGAELDVWCHELARFVRLDPAKISANLT